MSEFNPALDAMRQAMKDAEEAAERRRIAKLGGEASASPDLDIEMLAELALIQEPVTTSAQPAHFAYAIEETEDLDLLIAQATATIPDGPGEERDGDLVVINHEIPAKPWYQEAAEAALPEALRQMAGPTDIKALLQALIVEVGDVKRTNALIMEQLSRVEEKVERTNRQLKERRHY